MRERELHSLLLLLRRRRTMVPPLVLVVVVVVPLLLLQRRRLLTVALVVVVVPPLLRRRQQHLHLPLWHDDCPATLIPGVYHPSPPRDPRVEAAVGLRAAHLVLILHPASSSTTKGRGRACRRKLGNQNPLHRTRQCDFPQNTPCNLCAAV